MIEKYQVLNLTDKEFDDFIKGHKHGDFSQTTGWAKVKADNWYSRTVVIGKEGQPLGGALLLFRNLPKINATLCYAPRGLVVDYGDLNLVERLIQQVKAVAKEEESFTIKIDPNVKRDEYPGLVEFLKEQGFSHNGFSKGLVDVQPRWTFLVDLDKDFDEVFKGFNSQTRNLIRKAEKNGVVCNKRGKEALDIFWKLMEETGNRDEILVRNPQYYRDLMDAFEGRDEIHLFIASLDVKKVLDASNGELATVEKDRVKFQKKLEATDDPKKQKNFKDELKILDGREAKAKDRIHEMTLLLEAGEMELPLAGAMIMTFGAQGYYLYAASSDSMRELNPSYFMQKTMMEYAKSKGVKEYDLGGISGFTEADAEFEKDKASGLYMFKRQFGGEMCEKVGEFNCKLRPVLATAFELALKVREKVKR